MLLNLLIDKADCGRPTLHLQRVIVGLGFLLLQNTQYRRRNPTTIINQYKSSILIQNAQDNGQRQQWIRRNVKDAICLNNENITVINFIFAKCKQLYSPLCRY